MADLVVDARRDGDFGLVRLRGEARLEEIDLLRERARAVLAAGAKHLLVGLQGLTFADSASVGALMELEKDVTARGGAVVLHGMAPRLAEMLDAMGLSGRFKVAANEAAARKAV